MADIPIIALVPHNTLQIDEISVDFNTKIKNLTDKKLLNSANSLEVAHADYDMTIESGTANGDDIMHVNVKFKASPSPEGLSRVIDEQNKVI